MGVPAGAIPPDQRGKRARTDAAGRWRTARAAQPSRSPSSPPSDRSFTPNESFGEFPQKGRSVVAPQFDRVAQTQTSEDGAERVDAGRINDAAEEAFIG